MMLRRRDVCAWAVTLVPAGAAAAPAEAVWHDAARGRDVPVLWRIPPSPGPWPLVMHSHGLGGPARA